MGASESVPEKAADAGKVVLRVRLHSLPRRGPHASADRGGALGGEPQARGARGQRDRDRRRGTGAAGHA